MKNIFTLILASLGFGVLQSQTTMNIYQSNGTNIILPIATIDSMNFTTSPPPTSLNIYQYGGGIIIVVLANIDSITYTVASNSNGLPILSTMPVGNITNNSAVAGGNIVNDGGSAMSQRGVVWSNSPNPTTANNQSSNGSGIGNYISSITGLAQNTTFYVRAYATNANGTAYGNELSFITSNGGGNIGTITALNCNNSTNTGTLTVSTAASGVSSSVLYTGGNGGSYNSQAVSSSGVTGLTATLTAGNFTNGAGSLTYNITGTAATSGTANFYLSIGGQNCTLSLTVNALVGSITALYCNYANSAGTLIEGSAASAVSSTIIYSGGNGGTYNGQTISSTGVTGLTATLSAGNFANGVGNLTYAIVGTPTMSGTANFALNVGGQNCTLGLNVNTAIQSNPGAGVTYGGINYPTVLLGNGQEWMAQNLNTTQYNDGTAITLVTDDAQWTENYNNGTTLPMMCWYNNDQATYTANTFGALYNWYAVSPTTNGNRNVCPVGWHVPTNTEWTILTDYLGDSLVAGGKMKSTGTQYWQSPNTAATNESGFSGLPGGYRNYLGTFYGFGYYGIWWSSTENNTYNAWDRLLDYGSGVVTRDSRGKENGFSVRCLRD